ncbi:hypothetical protein D9M68_570410 [compost metagenome]
MAVEVSWRTWRAVTFEVAGCCIEAEGERADLALAIIALQRPDEAQHDISLFADQPHRPDARMHLKADLRMASQEPRQPGQQHLLPEQFRHVDTDRPGEIAVLLARRALEDAHLRLGALSRRHQVFAGGRQVITVAMGPEKLDLQRRFQCLDPARHGRCAHTEPGRRGTQRPRIGDGQKELQIIPVHLLSIFGKSVCAKVSRPTLKNQADSAKSLGEQHGDRD